MTANSELPVAFCFARGVPQVWLLVLLAVGMSGGGRSLAASPGCVQMGVVPSELHVAVADASTVTRTITIPQQYRESVRVQGGLLLSGGCQTEVLGFEVSNVYLKSGLLVEISDSNAVSPIRSGASSSRFSVIRRGEAHPTWDMGDFVMASRVDSRRSENGVTDYFVGVWRGRKSSTLGIFTRSPEGAFTQPTLLLTSNLPIRSVSYFPSPDTPSGRLGIMQERRDELQLINVSWYHPQFTK